MKRFLPRMPSIASMQRGFNATLVLGCGGHWPALTTCNSIPSIVRIVKITGHCLTVYTCSELPATNARGAGGFVAAGAATQYEAESRPSFAAAIYTGWNERLVPARERVPEIPPEMHADIALTVSRRTQPVQELPKEHRLAWAEPTCVVLKLSAQCDRSTRTRQWRLCRSTHRGRQRTGQ
jgi:hypothetical protein